MNKSLILLLFFFLHNLPGFTQIADEEARRLYDQAEEAYEAGNFYDCYKRCIDLKNKMGKTNPRILYLQIRAIYNNLEKKNDKSESILRKSYRNYNIMHGYAEEFFRMVDKKTYPPEKYSQIEEIARYFKDGMKEYEAEKDRTPADAIAFLNECAQKFKIRYDPGYKKEDRGQFSVNFSLDSTILHIEVFANCDSEWRKGFDKAGRERIRIDLSKVWIDKTPKSYGAFINESYFGNFFNDHFIFKETKRDYYGYGVDNAAPFIIGPTIYIEGKAVVDPILWYWNYNYNKGNKNNMPYPLEDFNERVKFNGFKKRDMGFYIYNYFNQSSEEFKAGNYRKRIRDAFEFLMEYFGGGVPVENKPQASKSKF